MTVNERIVTRCHDRACLCLWTGGSFAMSEAPSGSGFAAGSPKKGRRWRSRRQARRIPTRACPFSSLPLPLKEISPGQTMLVRPPVYPWCDSACSRTVAHRMSDMCRVRGGCQLTAALVYALVYVAAHGEKSRRSFLPLAAPLAAVAVGAALSGHLHLSSFPPMSFRSIPVHDHALPHATGSFVKLSRSVANPSPSRVSRFSACGLGLNPRCEWVLCISSGAACTTPSLGLRAGTPHTPSSHRWSSSMG